MADGREHGRIARRAGIVALGTLVSRLLGLVREQVLAATFSRAATDAFFVAFTIPNVLRQLLAEGAVQTGVLPVLAQVREREGDQAAREAHRAIRGLSLVILFAVSVAGVVGAPGLVWLFASGFSKHPGLFDRTVALTRWVFPYIFFMGTAALGVAALNAHKRFVVTSLAPALLNVAFVVAALALPTWLHARGHDPIFAMAIGALVGGALQVVAQWPALAALGYLGLPTWRPGHPAVREVVRRMGPVLFGIGVYYIDMILARRFLSDLPVGATSYFTYAMRLCDFPQGIFVMALSSATLPSLAALAARDDREELGATLAYALRLAMFVAVPATAVFVVLAEPIVVAVFQRGAFDAHAAAETARALIAQGAGIFLVAGVRQLVSVYYAVGDTRTPVIVSAIDLVAFVALALVLRGPLGHVGVGWAVTFASAVQLGLLFSGLRRVVPLRSLWPVASSLLRTGVATAVASATAAAVALLCRPWLAGGGGARLLPALLGASAFAAAFLLTAALVRSPELVAAAGAVRRKLGRRGQAT